MPPLAVVGGGTALGFSVAGGRGGAGGGGGGLFAGAIRDGTGPYPCKRQSAGRPGLHAILYGKHIRYYKLIG